MAQLCARIGYHMAKTENNKGVRREDKLRSVLSTYSSSISPHLHILGCSSRSVVCYLDGCCLIARTEVEGRFTGPYFELLAQRLQPQGSRTIWRSRKRLAIGEWLPCSYSPRMGLNISGAQRMPSSLVPVSMQPRASCAASDWSGTEVLPYSTG